MARPGAVVQPPPGDMERPAPRPTTPDRYQAAGRRNFQEHGTVICPTCSGSGQVVSQDWRGRSRKGGNASCRRSLEPGAISMSDRGRRGGRPRALRLEDLD